MNQTKKFNNIVTSLRYKPGQFIRARMGLRTNGDLHIGNLFPLVAGFLLGESLIKRGHPFEFTIYLVDQEINPSGRPFRYTLTKSGRALADESVTIIKSFVRELRLLMPEVKVVYRMVSRTQRTRKFRVLLKQILENDFQKINIESLCPKHKVAVKAKYRGDKISFFCDKCRKVSTHDLFDKSLELMLGHDVLGVIEDNFFPMDIHIIGRDHAVATRRKDSALKFREKLQKILGIPKHITFLTPLVVDSEGRKMSKSDKRGLFLSEIRKGDYSIQSIVDLVRKNINKNRVIISQLQ